MSKFKKIESVEELLNIVMSIPGEPVEFFINLKGGLRSSKSICYIGNGEISVLHEIDGHEDILKESELSDVNKTNIPLAIANGVFYQYL